jgi:hypothetical protein
MGTRVQVFKVIGIWRYAAYRDGKLFRTGSLGIDAEASDDDAASAVQKLLGDVSVERAPDTATARPAPSIQDRKPAKQRDQLKRGRDAREAGE